MKKIWILVVLVAVILLWWAAARNDSVPAIHFGKAERLTISSIVSTNGKAEPVQYSASRAEIPGVVKRIDVERGQQVKAGQTLVVLDNANEQAAVDTARAQLEQAKADEAMVQQGGKASQLASIESNLRTARLAVSEAERNLASTERLYAKQAATEQEKLAAQNTLERAKLQVESLELSRKTLVTASDRTISSAKLQDAKTALDLALHRLELTTLRAPTSGTLYQFDIRLGTYLNLGDPVAMIGNLDQIRVRVYVDEPDLGRVALGMPVQITWDARPGQKWTGQVTRTPTEIVALGTRQVGVVTCDIQNPKHELLPGTNVDVSIVSKVVNNAIAIPRQALQSTTRGRGVFKLQGDRVVWQPVQAGINDVSNVEIRSGLREGDRVALPSDASLSNGAKVKVLSD